MTGKQQILSLLFELVITTLLYNYTSTPLDQSTTSLHHYHYITWLHDYSTTSVYPVVYTWSDFLISRYPRYSASHSSVKQRQGYLWVHLAGDQCQSLLISCASLACCSSLSHGWLISGTFHCIPQLSFSIWLNPIFYIDDTEYWGSILFIIYYNNNNNIYISIRQLCKRAIITLYEYYIRNILTYYVKYYSCVYKW